MARQQDRSSARVLHRGVLGFGQEGELLKMACSIPATPVMESAPLPTSWQPRRVAISVNKRDSLHVPDFTLSETVSPVSA
jgi:hypothetical protein